MSLFSRNFLPITLARAIRDGKQQTGVSAPATRIATAGVAVGVAVMILTVAVITGFRHTIREKVRALTGDVVIENYLAMQASDQVPIAVDSTLMEQWKRMDGVEGVSAYALRSGILKTDKDFLGVSIKGITLDKISTSFLKDNLTEGHLPQPAAQGKQNEVLISADIARRMNLKVGDRPFSYFIEEDGVRTRRVTVCGIYETNLSWHDTYTVYADIALVRKLQSWESDQQSAVQLHLTDMEQAEAIAKKIRKDLKGKNDPYGESYIVRPLKELARGIFSWLDLLDVNAWVILILMIAVASATAASGLLIVILEHTAMIGTLKALGARDSLVGNAFLCYAVQTLTRGLIIGNIIALALIGLQAWTGFVRVNPADYYVSAVPVEIGILQLLLINAVTAIVCTAILALPAMVASRISPAKTMRVE